MSGAKLEIKRINEDGGGSDRKGENTANGKKGDVSGRLYGGWGAGNIRTKDDDSNVDGA